MKMQARLESVKDQQQVLCSISMTQTWKVRGGRGWHT